MNIGEVNCYVVPYVKKPRKSAAAPKPPKLTRTDKIVKRAKERKHSLFALFGQ